MSCWPGWARPSLRPPVPRPVEGRRLFPIGIDQWPGGFAGVGAKFTDLGSRRVHAGFGLTMWLEQIRSCQHPQITRCGPGLKTRIARVSRPADPQSRGSVKKCPGGALGQTGFFQELNQVGPQVLGHVHTPHGDVTFVVVHKNLFRAILTWTFAQIMTKHHEVKAAQKGFVQFKVRVIGKLLNVGHRIAVPNDFQRRPMIGVKRLFVLKKCKGVVQGDVVARNAVGAADGAGTQVPPEYAPPPSRLMQDVPQRAPVALSVVDQLSSPGLGD
jgi:hypothetical protein